MSDSKPRSIGFLFDNCENVVMTGNSAIGLDIAVQVINSRNIRAESNTVVSREVVEAISLKDKAGLIAALGLPVSTPASFIGEALQAYGRNAGDESAASREISDSRLARFIGVSADLSQLVGAFAGLVNSGLLASASTLLFS